MSVLLFAGISVRNALTAMVVVARQSLAELPSLDSGVQVSVKSSVGPMLEAHAPSGVIASQAFPMDVDCDPTTSADDMELKAMPVRVINIDVSDLPSGDDTGSAINTIVGMVQQPPSCALIGIVISHVSQPALSSACADAASTLRRVAALVASPSLQVLFITVQKAAAIFSLGTGSSTAVGTAFAFHEPDGVIDAHTVSKIPALLSQLLLSWYTILV